MKGSDGIIRKLAHDFVQRMRIVLSSTVPDKIDALNRETVEDLTEDMCSHMGVEYDRPADVPRRVDGRAAPWARKGRKEKAPA